MAQTLDLREIRGLEIYKGDEVKRINGSEYKVKSQSKKGLCYLVIKEGDAWKCECPDHLYRNVICKHIHAVVFSLTLRDKVESQSGCLGLPNQEPDNCKYCSSSNIVKRGLRRNKNYLLQVFMCKDCKRRFVMNDGFAKMSFDPSVITIALDLYFKGVSFRKITDHIKQFYNVKVHFTSIIRWIQKYSRLIAEYLKSFTPDVSDVWHIDEMTVNINGKKEWLWNLMDDETRFLISCQISKKREVSDARKPLAEGKIIANKKPNIIITDGLQSYHDAVRKEYFTLRNPRTRHVRLPSIRDKPNNNIVERLHGTIREREKVMRALDNGESAKKIIDGLKAYYNFLRPHQALDGKTPAEVAGINLELRGNRWLDLIKKACHDNASHNNFI